MSLEQAFEQMDVLTDIAVSKDSDDSLITLGFKNGLLHVITEDGLVRIRCDFVRALDGVALKEEAFLATVDAFQAAVLQEIDGVQRLPDGFSYPDDFLYSGETNGQ